MGVARKWARLSLLWSSPAHPSQEVGNHDSETTQATLIGCGEASPWIELYIQYQNISVSELGGGGGYGIFSQPCHFLLPCTMLELGQNWGSYRAPCLHPCNRRLSSRNSPSYCILNCFPVFITKIDPHCQQYKFIEDLRSGQLIIITAIACTDTVSIPHRTFY
jgi:hypothetical protein